MNCECADPGCPECQGKCPRKALTIVKRIDMEDVTGTPMCRRCAEDALDSGLFTEHRLGNPKKGTKSK